MPELRVPVMIRVEASWEDESGALRTVPACMEDKSVGGACIRIRHPIVVGARLVIQWRFEQFSGIARYCRSDGRDCLVGIQRDATFTPLAAKPAPPPSAPPVPSASAPAQAASKAGEAPPAQRNRELAASPHWADEVPSGRRAPPRIDPQVTPRYGTVQFNGRPKSERPPRPATRRKESAKERKPMRRKWLDPSTWGQKDERSGAPGGKQNNTGNARKENSMPDINASQKSTSSERNAAFQIDLLPMEEIYRAAGILAPRKGYSIRKVVEMANSEHIRNQSKDMKRVAVLMALDAAGVPIDEVLQDAKLRQEALDSYEATQRKEIEAEWTRREEECEQIEAELETLKAHYKARIGRNKDGVAREKAIFNEWLASKQQESQSIAEAMELCSKAPRPEMAKAAASASAPISGPAKPTPEQAKSSSPDLATAKAAGAKG